jgi:hypothetical protein
MIKLSLSNVEMQLLLVWAKQASDTTFTDLNTRRAMQEFLTRLLAVAKKQALSERYPNLDWCFGDFS